MRKMTLSPACIAAVSISMMYSVGDPGVSVSSTWTVPTVGVAVPELTNVSAKGLDEGDRQRRRLDA